jgi:autotransporter-associated beta strand protein
LDGVVISAPITVGGSGTTATISAPTNTPGAGIVSMLTLNSVLAGSGQVTFSSSAAQNALSTVYLGGQSTYAGGTELDTAGTNTAQIILRLGVHNALPTNTVLTIDGQTGAGTGRYAELNLNGFNQTLAGLTNIARSLRLQRIVNSDVSAPATLAINNVSNFTFSGNLGSPNASGSVAVSAMPGSSNGNNFSLLKRGSGILNLTGTNSYAGNTTVSNGTLALVTAFLATNSTVTVASGAVLQLNFATTNRVGALILNGVSKPGGTYNSANAAPFITGPGSLLVPASGPSGPALLTNSYSGGVLSFSWPAGQGWKLQQQTNALSTGLSTNWVDVTDSSVSSTNIPVDPTKPATFYRLVYP